MSFTIMNVLYQKAHCFRKKFIQHKPITTTNKFDCFSKAKGKSAFSQVNQRSHFISFLFSEKKVKLIHHNDEQITM